jgi:hypothetical protein
MQCRRRTVKNPIAKKLHDMGQALIAQADLLETIASSVETELDAAAFRELLDRITEDCPLEWEDDAVCPFGYDDDACQAARDEGELDYKDCFRALYQALAVKAHPQEEN